MTDLADDASRHLTFHRSFLPVWEAHAASEATRCGAVVHTFAEHRERVFRIANALGSELGLDRGGRFAVLALNSSEYLELYHAAYFGGGVINPLNIRLAAPELAFILADSGTEVVFVDRQFAPTIAAIRAQVPSLRSVVLIGNGTGGDGTDRSYDDVLAAGSAEEPPETEEGDPTCLMYTGGTTGLPKGVLHTQRSHTLMSQIARPLFDLGPDRIFLASTPLFHGASLAAFNIAPGVGCPVVVMPVFSPDGFLDLAAQSGATNTVLVPTMARMVIDSPNFDATKLGALRSFLYGGSPMPLGVLARLLEALPHVDIVQGYGMTEGVPVSYLDGDAHRTGGDVLRSAGRAVPGVRLTVQDALGVALPAGEPGEVCVRSGLLMREYWNRPEETAAAFRGGWYHTGDVGYMDDAGFVYLVDRAKDMIVTGGENVYSSEVESAISTHAAVVDVAVIGIPSEEWGEAVHAVVVVRGGAAVTEDEILSHARRTIAGYKVPRSVELRTDALPVSGAGKTLKRALREPYWTGIDRRVS